MKYLYLFFTVLLFLFAVVQLNDPDPWLWFPMYAYGSVLSILMFRNKLNTVLPIIGLAVYIIMAIIFWPASFRGMENSMTIMRPEIEEARETGGMLISAAIMLFYVIKISVRHKNKVTS